MDHDNHYEKSLILLKLFEKCQEFSQEASDLLEDPTVDVNVSDPMTQITPLHYAVLHAQNDTNPAINQLLKRGANRRQPDIQGRTPLNIAFTSGQRKLFRLLMGIEFNSESLALLEALKEKRDISVIQTTLQKEGCDINVFDDITGNTPLHYALLHSYDDVVVEQLLEKGANPNIRNAEGSTAIHVAISHAKLPLLERFLKHKAIRFDMLNRRSEVDQLATRYLFRFFLRHQGTSLLTQAVILGLDIQASYDAYLTMAIDYYEDNNTAQSRIETLSQVQNGLIVKIQDIFLQGLNERLDKETAWAWIQKMPLSLDPLKKSKHTVWGHQIEAFLVKAELDTILPADVVYNNLAQTIKDMHFKRLAEFIETRFTEDWASKAASDSQGSPKP